LNPSSISPRSPVAQFQQTQRDIEEKIGEDAALEEAQETTSDFYQIPITGGIPVKLTFEKRPFTPPFAQLIKM